MPLVIQFYAFNAECTYEWHIVRRRANQKNIEPSPKYYSRLRRSFQERKYKVTVTFLDALRAPCFLGVALFVIGSPFGSHSPLVNTIDKK